MVTGYEIYGEGKNAFCVIIKSTNSQEFSNSYFHVLNFAI